MFNLIIMIIIITMLIVNLVLYLGKKLPVFVLEAYLP